MTRTADSALYTGVMLLGMVVHIQCMTAVNVRTATGLHLITNKFYGSDWIKLPYSVWLVHTCSMSQQLLHHLIRTLPCSQHYWWASGLYTYEGKGIFIGLMSLGLLVALHSHGPLPACFKQQCKIYSFLHVPNLWNWLKG